MHDAGVQIRDYLGDFITHHVDLSDGRVALKISPREVEILGESLVKEVIGWAMGSESSPWPEYGNYDADFLAGLRSGQQDVKEDDVVVRFTSRDVLALGQFFVLGMLRWAPKRANSAATRLPAQRSDSGEDRGPGWNTTKVMRVKS
jgi:hypothetical protein